jgi:hypothetical protein
MKRGCSSRINAPGSAWRSGALVRQERTRAPRPGQLPKTWNSHSEYPYWVARVVPYMRT